jgi:hypothetical protein
MNLAKQSLLAIFVLFALSACAPSHHRRATTVTKPKQPVLATEVYYFPMQEQSIEQQDRDRFECYLWAKEETGFDPSHPHLIPHQRTYVVPDPEPGTDTVAGAFTGAMLGAIIGAPHSSGEGAVIGAIAGGALGAASDSARQERAVEIEKRINQGPASSYAALERQANQYRRAMKACLEGRGYKVR